MAIYVIDQDTVEGGGKIIPDDRIGGELSSQAAAVETSLAAMNMPRTSRRASPLSKFGDISERSRERMKAERERNVAAEAITGLVEELLKTRLQVNVTIEIDFIEPTLVVLGSCCRSALKGNLLGSFSN